MSTLPSILQLPVVYIAGPYTGGDPVANTRQAIEDGMGLVEEELAVPLIPHLTLLAHLVHPEPVEVWYNLDNGLLARSDALWRIPGESTGADAEVRLAKSLDLPVFTCRLRLVEWCLEYRS